MIRLIIERVEKVAGMTEIPVTRKRIVTVDVEMHPNLEYALGPLGDSTIIGAEVIQGEHAKEQP
jgi:hypothetical protein